MPTKSKRKRTRKKPTTKGYRRVQNREITQEQYARRLGITTRHLRRWALEHGLVIETETPERVKGRAIKASKEAIQELRVLADDDHELESARVSLDKYTMNRKATDQQMARILAKLRCHLESKIDAISEHGILSDSELVTYVAVAEKLQKIEADIRSAYTGTGRHVQIRITDVIVHE